MSLLALSCKVPCTQLEAWWCSSERDSREERGDRRRCAVCGVMGWWKEKEAARGLLEKFPREESVQIFARLRHRTQTPNAIKTQPQNNHGRRFSSKRTSNGVLLRLHSSSSGQLPTLEGFRFRSIRISRRLERNSRHCKCGIVSSTFTRPLPLCL